MKNNLKLIFFQRANHQDSSHLRLLIVLVILCFGFASVGIAQGPINEDDLMIEIRSNSFTYSGECVPGLYRPTFLWDAELDMNDQSDYLMNFEENVPAGHSFCLSWEDANLEGSTVNESNLLITGVANSNGSKKIDIEFQSFNKLLVHLLKCVYESTFAGDDCFYERAKYLLDPMASGISNEWNNLPIVISSYASCDLRYTWRFAHGDNFDDPLDFGVINYDSRSHRNNNRSHPGGATSVFSGYTNAFTSIQSPFFQNAVDVVYKFTIIDDAKEVFISLRDLNFDARFHLLSESGVRFATQFGTTPMVADLGAGDYYVVVEGYDFGNESGDFTLVVEVPRNASVNPGSITQPTQTVYCPIADDWPGILSASSPSPSNSISANLGVFEFQWQYQVNNEGSWINLFNENELNMTAGLDVMTENIFDFRRRVTIAGNIAYSDTVSISYLPEPGVIELLGSDRIPVGVDPGEFISVTDASGTAGIIQYDWFTSTNGTSFSTTFTNAPTYDIPPLTQTTWFKRIAKNGCSISGSTESNTIKIEVLPEVDCNNIPVLSCPGGGVLADNNDGFGISDLICNFQLANGPKVLYQFEAFDGEPVIINLSGLMADLDLYLLDDCSTMNCIASSRNSGIEDERIETSLSNGTYYILIDGFLDAQSQFGLSLVSCGIDVCNEDIVLQSPENDLTGNIGMVVLTNKTITASNKMNSSQVSLLLAQNGTSFVEGFEIGMNSEVIVTKAGCGN